MGIVDAEIRLGQDFTCIINGKYMYQSSKLFLQTNPPKWYGTIHTQPLM